MDSQDEANSVLEPADAASSEPVPATMSRGSEFELETPAAPGKLPDEATVAEPQFRDTGADADIPVKGPETSTPIKKFSPSRSEVNHSELVPSVGVPPLKSGVSGLALQHTHVHNDWTGASINIIRDSHMSNTQLSLVASPLTTNSNNKQVPTGNSQLVNSPHDLSHSFGKACLCIAKCLEKEGKLDELKLVLQSLSCHNTTDTLLPDALAAETVVQLFTRAAARRLWHWLDFEYMTQLLDTISSEKAKKILQDYEKHLLLFCEEELSAVIPYKESSVSPTEQAWMDVKWNGDTEKFKLGSLYKCKKFLVNHLGIPSSAFVFYELFPGCITLRWVILTSSACAAIEAKSCTGCIQFLDADMEIKLVHPMKPPKQNVTHSSVPEEVCDTDEYLFFGDREYVFSQHVPKYAQCPICLGILQHAVVTSCCHGAFCLDCCEKANKASRRCPICRREGFQHARDKFIDKHVVGNILAQCCRCKWTGYLWNALSVESHPCLSDTKVSEEEPQEETPEAAEAISKERQEEASAMATALPHATSFESQNGYEEKGSLVSEKGPLLEAVQTLLSHLRTLHACINEEGMTSSGECLSPAAPEILRDAVDEFTAILQDMEENFLAAEGSIISGPSRRLSVVEDGADGPQQRESRQGGSAIEQLVANETAVVPHLGVTSPSAEPLESVISSARGNENIYFQDLAAESFPHATPQLVQSPEQSAAQKTLAREAERITYLAAKAGQVSLLQQLLTATGINPNCTSYARESLLYIACQFGYTDMAQMLISLGASVLFQSDNGRSPLHGAAYSGSLPCLELLLEKDADISVSDLSGDTPLHTAAQQGHAAFAEKLLHHSHMSVNKRNACGQTPLHRAAQSSSCEVTELLLKSDATLDAMDDEGFTPVHIAVKAGNAEAVKVLLDNKANPNLALTESGLTPLHSAARQADGLQLIQLLHAAGADVAAHDHKGRSVLHHAIKSSSLEVLQTVVEMGCPIDDVAQETPGSRASRAEGPYRLRKTEDGSYVRMNSWGDILRDENDVQSGETTPLYLAILSRKADFVRFLLSKGADVLKTTKTGCAAIHMAVRSGEASFVREVISAGSSTDVKTHDGLAPLHLAAQWGHKDAALELIKAGCNKEQLTGGKQKSKAMTALLVAAMKHQTEMVQTLAEAGCQVQATTADGHNAIHLAVSAALHTDRESYHANTRFGYSRSRRYGTETITLLVRLGCDINAMNVNGLSPLDLAQKGYHYRSYEDDLELMHEYHRGHHYSSHLDTTLRRLGALTGHEIQRKAALSQTLDHATKSAESIQLKLATKPKTARPRVVVAGEWMRQRILRRVGDRVPSSYDLSRLVVPHVSHLWRDIGSNLEIAPDRLDEADADCSGDALECCMKVFNFWLSGEGKGPKTWNTLLVVLRTIGCRALAESVMHQLHVYCY